MSAYYEDTNGRICCVEHAGNYVHAALAAKPNLKRIETPMTMWIKLTDADIAEVATWNADICETCHFA
jgi:hypothetical protein